MLSDKNTLRKEFLKIRQSIEAKERKLKSRKICENLVANFKLPKSYIIAGYNATKSEVDTKIALEIYAELGNQICLPKLLGKNQPMEFRAYSKGLELQKNSDFNFLEPKNTKNLVPDMVICPLVAFDAKCNRIGMGGGFYDRTLDQLSGHKDLISIGVAFSEQQTAYIESEAFDFQLDAIITENRVFFRDKIIDL